MNKPELLEWRKAIIDTISDYKEAAVKQSHLHTYSVLKVEKHGGCLLCKLAMEKARHSRLFNEVCDYCIHLSEYSENRKFCVTASSYVNARFSINPDVIQVRIDYLQRIIDRIDKDLEKM